ncbi:MAG: hypothetical protein U1F10_13035 [Burkholderiales bacterium]
MNLLSIVTDPITTLWDAVARPIKALFVVAICYFINRVTSPENPWWHWVAFGMSIAVLIAWARALRTILLLAAIYYVGRWIYGKYGEAAKSRFDAWVSAGGAGASAPASSQPKDPKDVLRLVNNDAAMREAGIVR